MKSKIISILLMGLVSFGAFAQGSSSVKNNTIAISNKLYGTSNLVMRPGALENALVVNENIYHVPQFMPQYPTAAVLWPRVIEVECSEKSEKLVCDGYHTFPQPGRTEYLFFTPRIKEEPKKQDPIIKEVEKIVVVEKPVTVEKTIVIEKPVTIYKEVSPKKIKE